jgi:hypothetical protein
MFIEKGTTEGPFSSSVGAACLRKRAPRNVLVAAGAADARMPINMALLTELGIAQRRWVL